MTNEIMNAYKDVELAVEHYTKLLQEHATLVQNMEPPGSDKVVRVTQGSRAMRDSAMIYLSYAKYVAYGMPESTEMIDDDAELQG
ncbi:MAG: hypothetical protein ACKOBZ_03610 [Nitrospira sp.]|nr:hypothetical protein [Nitrospira sp.]